MGWLADHVIKYRKLVITIYAALFVLFGVGAAALSVNYNIADYLPAKANSTEGLKVLETSFGAALPNATVMAPAATVSDGIAIKDQLMAVDGISDVMWLDDVADIHVPLSSLDSDVVQSYYKDGEALYTVTIKEGEEQKACEAIRAIVGDEGALMGHAVEQANSQQMALAESSHAMLLLIPFIIIVLLLSTRSWIEPLLYFACLGVSIVINLGFSGFTGEISFVTLAVAPLLQLAVALDYAVFLSSAYTAAHEKTHDVASSVKQALIGSSKSIFASALVGVFAFAALLSMNFQIGPDMGWALVRGVIVSYLVVITLLPALIVTCGKALDKTRHRSFLPSFKPTGKALVAARLSLLLVMLALIVPSYLAQQSNSFIYGNGDPNPGSQIASDQERIQSTFDDNKLLVLMVPRGNPGAEQVLAEDIASMDGVKVVQSYATAVGNAIPSEFLGAQADALYSPDYARIIAVTSLPSEGDAPFALVKQVRSLADQMYGEGQTYLVGESANLYDMKETVTADNERVDILTIIGLFIVLLLVFRSIPVALISLVTIKAAIFANASIPYFMGTNLTYVGYMIVSIIMMGSAIDYGILLIDHYLLERRDKPKLEAMRAALPAAIPAMLVSALVLAGAGFTLGLTSTNTIVQPLGILLGRGAVIAFTASITLLPALLLACDRFIPALSYKMRFWRGEPPVAEAHGTTAKQGADGAASSER